MVFGMRLLSPAKVNLHLRVGPVRSDGFHPLVSWMVTVGLFDILDFSLDAAGRVTLVSSDPTLPVDDRNLIVRAARLLQTHAMTPMTNAPQGDVAGERRRRAWEESGGPPGVHVRVAKAIPTGGGLGGGSSNAAATLLGLNALWNLSFDQQQLTAMAAQLGSDVPFFLSGASSVCQGRGEIVRPIDPPAVCKWVLLMLPEISMPTQAVYQRFDTMHDSASASGWDEAVDWSQWRTLVAEELLRVLRNDLEPPAFDRVPELGVLRESAEQIAARPVRMSGSGSTLFTLFDTKSDALAVENEIQRQLSVRTPVVKTWVAPIAPDVAKATPGA